VKAELDDKSPGHALCRGLPQALLASILSACRRFRFDLEAPHRNPQQFLLGHNVIGGFNLSRSKPSTAAGGGVRMFAGEFPAAPASQQAISCNPNRPMPDTLGFAVSSLGTGVI